MSEIYAVPIESSTPKPQEGRPSKYDPKYCQELLDYFDIEPSYESEITVKYKNGDERTETKLVGNDLPTLAGFARKIQVHRDTLNEWSHNHPEFSDSLKKAKEMQEHILVSNGLQGLYQGAFAIFTAKNIINWRDKQEVTNELVGELQSDGTRRKIELFVNVGGGFLPTSITLPSASTGSSATVTTQVQSTGVASEGTKDIHSDNGNSQTSTS